MAALQPICSVMHRILTFFSIRLSLYRFFWKTKLPSNCRRDAVKLQFSVEMQMDARRELLTIQKSVSCRGLIHWIHARSICALLVLLICEEDTNFWSQTGKLYWLLQSIIIVIKEYTNCLIVFPNDKKAL